VQQPSYIQIWY